jgi:hypothetical protein
MKYAVEVIGWIAAAMMLSAYLEWRLSVGGRQRRVGCDWTLRRIWSIEDRISGEAPVKVPKRLGCIR